MNALKKYEVLLIDLDDTIWDTRSNGKESMRELFFEYGYDNYFSDFESYYDNYYAQNCELWRQYRLGKISKDQLIIDRLQKPLLPHVEEAKEEAYILTLNDAFLSKTTKKTKLLPHAMDVLKYLKEKGYRMYILSNGFEEVQAAKMNNSGLMPYFDGMILSDQVGVNKPHRKIFEEAVKRADSSKEKTLMIGDDWEADIEGAKAAEIDQAWFDQGIESSKGFKPTYHIHSLLELKELL